MNIIKHTVVIFITYLFIVNCKSGQISPSGAKNTNTFDSKLPVEQLGWAGFRFHTSDNTKTAGILVYSSTLIQTPNGDLFVKNFQNIVGKKFQFYKYDLERAENKFQFDYVMKIVGSNSFPAILIYAKSKKNKTRVLAMNVTGPSSDPEKSKALALKVYKALTDKFIIEK